MGRIRLRRIKDASGGSLRNFLKENVAPGSTVRTDDWQGYNGIEEESYSHEVARKTEDVGDNLLRLAHIVAGLLRGGYWAHTCRLSRLLTPFPQIELTPLFTLPSSACF